MQVYEFSAPYFEIGFEERFVGFANDETEQYLWLGREECSEEVVLPNVENVWIERDDQQWGGRGGITKVELRRDLLSIRLMPEMAKHMGGYDEFRVRLTLTDTDFHKVSEQVCRILIGYESILSIHN